MLHQGITLFHTLTIKYSYIVLKTFLAVAHFTATKIVLLMWLFV